MDVYGSSYTCRHCLDVMLCEPIRASHLCHSQNNSSRGSLSPPGTVFWKKPEGWNQAGWRSSLGTGSPSKSERGCCPHRLTRKITSNDTTSIMYTQKQKRRQPSPVTASSPETRCFSDSIILVTGLLCTVNVWNSCGPEPTVSGCWTMTLTAPLLVP